MLASRDQNASALLQELIELAKERWVDFRWIHPEKDIGLGRDGLGPVPACDKIDVDDLRLLGDGGRKVLGVLRPRKGDHRFPGPLHLAQVLDQCGLETGKM